LSRGKEEESGKKMEGRAKRMEPSHFSERSSASGSVYCKVSVAADSN